MTVGELGQMIMDFKNNCSSLMVDQVGLGFKRALYATFLSYLKVDQFSYKVPSYSDERGVFVEMLKTKSSGQISFFTIKPGMTRENTITTPKLKNF